MSFKTIEAIGVWTIKGKGSDKVEHDVKLAEADFTMPEALKEAPESDKLAPAKDEKKPDTK